MRLAVATLPVVGAVVLAGCSTPTLEEGCGLIGDTVDQTVIEVARVYHADAPTENDFDIAAGEIEKLLPPLKDAQMPSELEDAQGSLVERMDYIVGELREGKIDYAVTLASDMQHTWVNLSNTCSNL